MDYDELELVACGSSIELRCANGMCSEVIDHWPGQPTVGDVMRATEDAEHKCAP